MHNLEFWNIHDFWDLFEFRFILNLSALHVACGLLCTRVPTQLREPAIILTNKRQSFMKGGIWLALDFRVVAKS